MNKTDVAHGSPSDENWQKIRENVYSVVVPIFIFLCLCAIFANGFILIVAGWVKKRKFNPTLKLTLSLAAADAWTASVIACALFANSYAQIVLGLNKPLWYDCAAYGLEALRLGGILTSVLHLLFLSFNHYLAAAHPLSYKTWTIDGKLRIIINFLIVLLWLIPAALFFAIFGAYSERTFVAKYANHRHSSACSAGFLDEMGVRILIFSIIFVPLTVMTVVYAKIACVLSNLRRQLHNYKSSLQQQNLRRCQNRVRRCSRKVITALLMVATFLIGWLPGIILYALTCPECPYPHTKLRERPIIFFASTITVNFLMISKGVINPFIYAVRIHEIQEAIGVLKSKCCCWRRQNLGGNRTRVSIRKSPKVSSLVERFEPHVSLHKTYSNDDDMSSVAESVQQAETCYGERKRAVKTYGSVAL